MSANQKDPTQLEKKWIRLQRFTVPAGLRQRVLLSRPTPAQLTRIMDVLEEGLNKHNLDDAAINLEFTLPGEVFGDDDLLPTIIVGLRKANATGQPSPQTRLILPDGTPPDLAAQRGRSG